MDTPIANDVRAEPTGSPERPHRAGGGADRAGEDDDDRAPSWKERAEERSRGHRHRYGHKPKRGKGYGYKREDE